MQKKTSKGLFILIGFVLVIFLLKVLFISSPANLPAKIGMEIRSIATKLGIKFDNNVGSYSPNLLTQEVVQEESQVIDVVDKVSPAVVSVVVKTVSFDPFIGPTSDESGIGTGFIVDKNGLIITDSHVVDSESGQYSVVLKDGTTYEVSKIHLDRQNDLAILEIKATDLATVYLGDSDKLKVGQTAIAIGNALGQFQNTVTVGVVSGIGRSITAGSPLGGNQKVYESVLQTDAAINPGNSGGPLLNSAGQVIGINVATSQGADNISFAIPVNVLKPILASFLKEGRIVKPYMGISYTMITQGIAQMRRLPQGAFVTAVLKNTPAENASLQTGDIITKFDGNDLGVGLSLSSAISKKKVGDTVVIGIDRNGTKIELSVTLAEMPANL